MNLVLVDTLNFPLNSDNNLTNEEIKPLLTRGYVPAGGKCNFVAWFFLLPLYLMKETYGLGLPAHGPGTMELISQQHIENKIFTVRNMQVKPDCDPDEMYQVEASSNLQPQIATTKGSASSYFSSELGETKPCIHLLYKIGKCDLKELSKRRSQNAAMRISDVNQYLWN